MINKSAAHRLILLMPDNEATFFAHRLTKLRPDIQTVAATDKAALLDLMAKTEHPTSLFGFLTDVIVPETILSELDLALNIHPGPPWMPGYRPTIKVMKCGERDYGATLHMMAKEVDTGPIIAVRRFQLPLQATLEQVETLTYQQCLQLALDHLDVIVGLKSPTPHPVERWGRR
nr:formyltransferase family protein [uncultured Cohaesibacter sp.]